MSEKEQIPNEIDEKEKQINEILKGLNTSTAKLLLERVLDYLTFNSVVI